MSGKGNIRFSELFADTLAQHGAEWCFEYYCVKHGMEYWEFRFWLTQCGSESDLAYYLP